MNSLRTTVFATLTACLATGASAQSATDYSLVKGHVFEQTGASNQANRGFYLDAKIDGVNPSQFSQGSLAFQSWQGDGFYDTTRNLDSHYHLYSNLFFDQGDLEQSYAGGFQFRLGNGGNVEDTGFLTPASYATYPSFSLLSQYNALQNLSAGQMFDLSVGGFTPYAGTNQNNTLYSLVDETTGITEINGINAGAGGFNMNIPAGLLMADHYYSINLDFSSQIIIPNDGFSGATSHLGYDSKLISYFYVPAAVPEPGTFAVLGFGAMAFLRRRKK